ncbi:unnamed protein product [Staurois parvus]|uniref:Uncharacterized protein n=1 Tax=Staurois parvus TaxID=386267 RepID=A0ABN9E517_9NEOB|nr:unnamed protein product [Staurois parvus]
MPAVTPVLCPASSDPCPQLYCLLYTALQTNGLCTLPYIMLTISFALLTPCKLPC